MVTKVEPGIIHIGETTIAASVILWAAGVAASPLGKKLGVPVDRAGRVHVQPDLTLAGRPEVFVIGDLAALNDESGKPLPGVAPVAIQEGQFVARTIKGDLAGKPRKKFKYFRQRQSGHHWTRGCGCRLWKNTHFRFLRLDFLALCSHFLSDRISESPASDDSMGVVILHLPARRTPDYWRHHASGLDGYSRFHRPVRCRQSWRSRRQGQGRKTTGISTFMSRYNHLIAAADFAGRQNSCTKP